MDTTIPGSASTSNLNPDTTTSVPEDTIVGEDSFSVTGDSDYDVRSMQEFSLEESKSEEKLQVEKSEKSEAAKKQETPNKETSQAPGKKDTEEAGDTRDNSDSGEKAEETTGSEDEDFIVVKSGEKEQRLARDAEVTIKINGKKETMTLQDALNKASGAVNVERENTRLGREKKVHEEQVKKFKQEAEIVNTHAQALLDMQDPYEFAEYYAALKGEDPDKVYAKLINQTVAAIEEWSQMTPKERELQREIRKHKRVEKQLNAKAKLSADQESVNQKHQTLISSIKQAGLAPEEYESALTKMVELVNNEESLGEAFDGLETLTEQDVIKYAILSKTNERITNAVKAIDSKAATDPNFISKLVKALTRSEDLHGKFSDAEVSELVREALKLDTKILRENLSKKVSDKVPTASKSVNSRKQEEDDDENDLTLEEYEERQRYQY